MNEITDAEIELKLRDFFESPLPILKRKFWTRNRWIHERKSLPTGFILLEKESCTYRKDNTFRSKAFFTRKRDSK